MSLKNAKKILLAAGAVGLVTTSVSAAVVLGGMANVAATDGHWPAAGSHG